MNTNILEKNLNNKIPFKKLKILIQEFRDSKQLSLFNPNVYKNAEINLGSKEAVIDLFVNSFVNPILKNLYFCFSFFSIYCFV